MNAYFLEDIISSTNLLLILIIGILFVALLYENIVLSKAEQNLQENKKETEILRKLFLNMKTPYIVINENGVISNANESALEIFDRPRENIIGSVFDPFFIIKNSLIESGKLEDSIRNNETYDFDSSLRLNNEQINCVFQITGVLQDDQVKYLLGIILHDPSETTEHDNNLRDERINRLEDLSNVGYFVFNHENNHVKWSRGLYKLLGATINETEPSLNFISQIDTTNQELQEIILSIQKMKPYSKKIKIKGLDGILRWVQLEITHQEGIVGDNSTLGILKLINSAETDLDKYIITSEELDLLDNPSFFQLILVGHDGKIQEVNEAFQKYLDLPKDEIIGKDFISLFPDEPLSRTSHDGAELLTVNYKGDTLFIKELAIDNCTEEIHLYVAFPVGSLPEKINE